MDIYIQDPLPSKVIDFWFGSEFRNPSLTPLLYPNSIEYHVINEVVNPELTNTGTNQSMGDARVEQF